MDVEESGDGAHGLDEDLGTAGGVNGEMEELDAHEGELGEQVGELLGLLDVELLVGGEVAGVEAVLAGVLVGGLAAAAASVGRLGGSGRRHRFFVRWGRTQNDRGRANGVGVHDARIGEGAGPGQGADGRGVATAPRDESRGRGSAEGSEQGVV